MISIFCMIVKLPADVHTGESLRSYKVFRSKNNKMDEEEFEMMIYYFLSLRRKPKINCAKKRRFWVRSIKQKKTW